MDAAAPSIEETVAALTARLDGAREIREHAERLLRVAEAQLDAARRLAVEAFGEQAGEDFFRTLSAINGSKPSARSRVPEMPGLAAELRAPWDPSPGTGGGGAMFGIPVDPGNRKAAERLVAEARKFAVAGDDRALEARAAKLYGQHQWRGELLRAAYAATVAELGPARPRPRPTPAGAAQAAEAAPVAAAPARPAVAAPDEGLLDPGLGWGAGSARPRREAGRRAVGAPSLFPVEG